MTLNGLRIAIVGPLPPPEGGMANQTRQLGELLRAEGAEVTTVRVNSPYRPHWIGRWRGVRALFRLVPYVAELWRVMRRVDVVHIMANSGWSWHLIAAPAVWIAKVQGVPSIVNYRGGEAEIFLERSGGLVLKTLRRASVLAVPSAFLQQVFARRGIPSAVVPNIIDIGRFRPRSPEQRNAVPRLVVARSLEGIYDIPTALRAFALIRTELPDATLTVAGSGPELQTLQLLASELEIGEAVNFCGRLDRDQMAELYRSACVVMNPSRVDNMPNSILEAMASGVPVVSTDAGGVPFILRDGVTGLIVPAGGHRAMAAAALKALQDSTLSDRLRHAALVEVQQYAWPQVKTLWAGLYASVLTGVSMKARPA
jgi:glycosyltransferase involved in cell wall biosynthesis